jgi:antitoxin HigA-1
MSKTLTLRTITETEAGVHRTLEEARQDQGILDEEVVIEGEEEKGDYPAPTLAERRVRPPHPGGVLLRLYLPGTGLTESEFAARLGVAPGVLSDLLHERRPMTADLAHRVARELGTSAQSWLNMQRECDEWDVLHSDSNAYETLEPLPRKKAA